MQFITPGEFIFIQNMDRDVDGGLRPPPIFFSGWSLFTKVILGTKSTLKKLEVNITNDIHLWSGIPAVFRSGNTFA